jgi:hypothetical protein
LSPRRKYCSFGTFSSGNGLVTMSSSLMSFTNTVPAFSDDRVTWACRDTQDELESVASLSGTTLPSSVSAAWTTTTSPWPGSLHLYENPGRARARRSGDRGRHRRRRRSSPVTSSSAKSSTTSADEAITRIARRANDPAKHGCYPSASRFRGPGVLLPSRGAGIAESSIRRRCMSLTKEVKLEIVEKHGKGPPTLVRRRCR